jgi:hypothetical protein
MRNTPKDRTFAFSRLAIAFVDTMNTAVAGKPMMEIHIAYPTPIATARAM